MKSHRRLALSLCLASLLASVAAFGAQPVGKGTAEVRKEQSAKPQAKRPAVQKAKASNKSASGKSASGARKKSVGKTVARPLPKPRLDLSLPTEMVEQLEPAVDNVSPRRKSLLPTMFPEKPTENSPFQLNGRLISNEMQLQLRNDSRRDLDGAAIEFEFKQ